MAQGYKQDLELQQATPAQVARFLSPDQSRSFLRRIEALDNLLALYGMQRSKTLYGRGFVISRRDAPNLSRWVDPNSSEESWLEDVKLLER